jgi:hypothetical protein
MQIRHGTWNRDLDDECRQEGACYLGVAIDAPLACTKRAAKGVSPPVLTDVT